MATPVASSKEESAFTSLLRRLRSPSLFKEKRVSTCFLREVELASPLSF